jgi:hypothetical protein
MVSWQHATIVWQHATVKKASFLSLLEVGVLPFCRLRVAKRPAWSRNVAESKRQLTGR